MEKSLYFQLVNKYFPQLVASVVEKLNGKNQTALTYMYRDHLTNTYSQEGRWASITRNTHELLLMLYQWMRNFH